MSGPSQAAKPRLNRNVRLVLVYATCLSMYSSLVSQTPLSAYILLLRPDDYTSVGVASGIQGVISLVVAFPAGALADCFGRQGLLRLAGIIALCTAVYTAAVLVILGDHLEQYLGSHPPNTTAAWSGAATSVLSSIRNDGAGGSSSSTIGSGISSMAGGGGGGSGDSLSSGGGGGSSLLHVLGLLGSSAAPHATPSALAAIAVSRPSDGLTAAAGLSAEPPPELYGGGDWRGDAGSGEPEPRDPEVTRMSDQLFYALCGASALWGLFMGTIALDDLPLTSH